MKLDIIQKVEIQKNLQKLFHKNNQVKKLLDEKNITFAKEEYCCRGIVKYHFELGARTENFTWN